MGLIYESVRLATLWVTRLIFPIKQILSLVLLGDS